MGAAFYHMAILKNNNLVAVVDGAKAMSHKHTGSSLVL